VIVREIIATEACEQNELEPEAEKYRRPGFEDLKCDLKTWFTFNIWSDLKH
jgi:hypothetical protein